jgi:CrcB protein
MKGIEFLLLGLGALAGAFLRYKIVESPILFGVLPINILIINVVGSFILGMFVVIVMNFNLDPKFLSLLQ